MKRFVLGLFLVVFVLSLAPLARGKFYGYIETKTKYYHKDCENCEWGVLGEFNLKFEEDFFDKKLEIFLNPVFRVDNLDFTEWVLEDDRQEPHGELQEGYLLLKPWDWLGLGFGKRISYWGVGEEVNPTSFNPRRYLNPVEPEYLGLLSAWARLDWKGFYLEIVGSKSSTSQLPWKEDHRWRPPELSGVIIEEPDIPDKPQFSSRIGWSGSLDDFSLMYFNGYKDVPGFEMVSSSIIEPVYFQTEIIGANLAVNFLGWFGIKAEAAYHHQDESDQDNYIQWILGVDRYFSWERHSLYIMFQYVKEDIIKDVLNPFQGLDFSRLLKNALTTKTKYDYGNWGAVIRAAYDFDEDGYYIQPKVSYSLDPWKVSLGYDYLGGPPESFFGGFEECSGIFMEVVYEF